MRLIFVLASLLVLTSACSDGEGAEEKDTTEQPTGAVWREVERPQTLLGKPRRVYQRFSERAPLPDCGGWQVIGNEPPDEIPFADCMQAGLDSGQGAEVATRVITPEGDPVWSYYRVTPDGGVEVFRDSTADLFGSRGWVHGPCPDLAAALAGLC